jgi:hypothetical protein
VRRGDKRREFSDFPEDAQSQLRTFGQSLRCHPSFQRRLKIPWLKLSKSATRNAIFFSRCYVSRETSALARQRCAIALLTFGAHPEVNSLAGPKDASSGFSRSKKATDVVAAALGGSNPPMWQGTLPNHHGLPFSALTNSQKALHFIAGFARRQRSRGSWPGNSCWSVRF